MVVMSCALLAACDNPFAPLEGGSTIDGLSYIDFSGTWERWDSDPEYDGFIVTLEYYNQYGTALEFADRAHTVKIEFYTQKVVGGTEDENGNITGGYTTYDQLIYAHTVTFRNTADDIYIAKELYEDSLRASGYDIDASDYVESEVFVLVHVYPPGGSPQQELVVGYPDLVVHKAAEGVTPNP